MKKQRLLQVLLALSTSCVAVQATAQDAGSPDAEQINNLISKRPYSPYAGRGADGKVAAVGNTVDDLDQHDRCAGAHQRVDGERAISSPIWYTP
jgi:hypothetical protein